MAGEIDRAGVADPSCNSGAALSTGAGAPD
jgi:hypothetical protein